MFVSLIFAALSWLRVSELDGRSIQVQFPVDQKTLNSCIEGGLEARYRVELQLCKRRKSWFDGCESQRAAINTIAFDPISRSYQVERDVLRDDQDPEQRSFRDKRKALDVAGVTGAIPLALLARGNENLIVSDRAYVSVNVEATCEGEYNESLAQLSYALTFGMLDIRREQSGWWDFPLRGLMREPKSEKAEVK